MREKFSSILNHSYFQDWYSGFKRDCPSGQLTPDMFVSMYSQVFPRGNAEQFSKHAFRTFDTDRNGFIDFKEFLLSIDVTSSGTPTEKLEWAFRYNKKNFQTNF